MIILFLVQMKILTYPLFGNSFGQVLEKKIQLFCKFQN